MKNIKSIIIAALAVGTITSCTEKMDNWGTDSSFNRLFSITSIKVTPEANTATVEYGGYSGAEKYQLQYSTSEMTDETEVGAEGTTTVESESKSQAELTGLIGETKYYLRVRAIATGKSPSKWVYYATSSGDKFFTTKGEQIFITPASTDIQEDGVRLTWDATKQVTAISVYKSDERKDTVLLSADQIAAGEYTFSKTFGESGEAIKASTTYKFYIWLTHTKRGSLSVQTAAAMPAGDYKYQLTAATTLIDNDLLKGYAATAAADGKTNYSVTIGIPAGTTLDFHGVADGGGASNINIPDGMSVTFFGMPGGDAPTLKFQKLIDLAGTHNFIAFENVKVVDDGAGYFVNQSATANINEITVKDAEVSGFATAFFRLKDSNGITINKLTLSNSIFHDMCSGYSFIHIDAGSGKGVVKNIAIDKCTLYNIATSGKMFIYAKNTDMESISVKNTTFYNCIGSNNYWIDFGSTSYGCSGDIELINCLFTKTPDTNTKNIRSKNTIVFTGSYKTNDFYKTFSGCGELDYTADDLFTAPASGDFTLKQDITCGDPRWYNMQ